MRLLSEREYISPLSPVCFLLNIQIRERKTTEIAENRGMQRREKRRGTKKKEKKKNGTTDRRSRGDRAEKMNSRAATCRSANRARIHRLADEYFTISGFRLDFALSLCFSGNGLRRARADTVPLCFRFR